ncbi:MAG: MarR family winged helix-turn-helix transcriptional regulator [Hyphomicrobiaceae bacterium]|nr:MarR family winged helix-turn-helix transcriptional regulator [Hyphomicrobiaceae bacterium]
MLRRTARHVSQAYDKALDEVGLKTSQYMVLAHVERTEGLTITQLARRLGLDRTTLTRNLQPLVNAGWIRISEAKDKRARALYPTESGCTLVARAKPLWQKAEDAFRRSMGKTEVAELRRLLDTAVSETGA